MGTKLEVELVAERLVTLSDKLARQVRSVPEGTHLQPVATESTATPLGDPALLEWGRVPTDAPSIGKDARGAGGPGVTAVAIARGPEAVTTPGSETAIAADETLVITGSHAACQPVETLLPRDERAQI